MESRSKSTHLQVSVLFVLGFTLTACGGDPKPLLSGASTGGTTNSPDATAKPLAVPLVITPGAPDLPPCTPPYAPVLDVLPTNATLPVFARAGDGLEVAVYDSSQNTVREWAASSIIALPSSAADLLVQARLTHPDCAAAAEFSQQYAVRDQYPPAAGYPDSTAIHRADTRLQRWATRVLEFAPGTNVGVEWIQSQRALGAAGDDPLDVTSLGEGGTITLGFDAVLQDGEGYDFAVFENGFGDEFLELAFVEVSSDGVHFVRFDTASSVDEPVSAYGTLAPTRIQGFAGKYRVGWGTPFDLQALQPRPEVRGGLVDLTSIVAVRIVDIVGDGRVRDSLGHLVYDPYPTSGGAGFDLDAVGLIHVRP